jgi:hypothetical protein
MGRGRTYEMNFHRQMARLIFPAGDGASNQEQARMSVDGGFERRLLLGA